MIPSVNRDDQARWLCIKDIFSEALEAEPEAREVILAARCGADSGLDAEVRSLLRLSEENGLSVDRATPSGVTPLESGPPPRHNCGEVLAGRYQIDHFLCAGGMGEVYAAVDLKSGESVALKFMHAFPTGRTQALSRFRREVDLAKSIQHPNVCRTIDLAGPADEPFFVMELLQGETLAVRLANGGPMAPQDALPLALQMCDGLTAAHTSGVLHRDLKPGNVFLVGGRAVIIDFGLASAMDHSGSLTSAGAVVGTLAYMAPEQLDGGTATTATDVYALGVILHEMLAGTKPFAAKSPLRLAAQKARQSGESTRLQGVPAVWEEVIGRCLHGNPAKRFQTPAAVRSALERGKPSLGFLLKKPRTLWPLLAAASLLTGWLAWSMSNRDYQPEAEAVALFAEAQQAMAQSSPWRGVQLLERAVARDPQFLQARSLLAVSYAVSDQLDKARDMMLETTAAADRRWQMGRLERLSLAAARAEVIRDFPSAIGAYRSLVESSRGAERNNALLSLARTSAQHGKPDEGIQALTELLNGDRTNTAARVLRAGLLARQRQSQKAMDEFAAAEAEYERTENKEGLSDVLLARSGTQLKESREKTRQDALRVLDLSGKTGNRFHHLMAKFRLAATEQSEGHFDEAMLLAREAAGQAEREGMLGLAAMAMGEFGYGFLSLRRYEPAAEALRESVAMAERSKSYGVLATNRLRLGEVLSTLHRNEEALAVMRPAVDWFRKGGHDMTLPLVLIKWGTSNANIDPPEAERSFLEALKVAERNGDEMVQSMALQRLGGFYALRDLRKATEYNERAIPLIRRVRNTGVFFQAAAVAISRGQFQIAEDWITEGERQTTGYPDILNRVFLSESAHIARAVLLYSRGQCSSASEKWAQVRNKDNLRSMGVSYELRSRRIDVCVSPQRATGHLRWANDQLHANPRMSEVLKVQMNIAVGEFALRTGKWEMAKRSAEMGLAASSRSGLRVLDFENLLILRAAEMRLGNRERGLAVTQQIQQLAPEIGIAASPDFAGRYDLKLFWQLAEEPTTKPSGAVDVKIVDRD